MKNLLFNFSLPVLLVVILFSSCTNGSKEAMPELPDTFSDFPPFYHRFHADTAFQVAHIQWPLLGKPSSPDSTALQNGQFYWQREAWSPHQAFDFEGSEFVRKFTPFGEDILIEKIVHSMGEFGMVRRWVRTGGDWYLIYYAEVRKPTEATENQLKIEGGF